MGLTLQTTRRVLSLAGRGARGAVGINLLAPLVPGQILAKAAGGARDYVGITGATPANAVAATDLAGNGGSALVGFLRSSTAAVTRSLFGKLMELPFTPEDFGAVGDGVANDTTALLALVAAVNAAGGGTVTFGPGKTYRTGIQTLAGATGKGYSYQNTGGLYFAGCTNLRIVGNGATIKWMDGLHFGGFDPTTGAATGSGSTADRQAVLGSLLRADNCPGVVIENINLDGNLPNLTIGVTWGSGGGIQLEADGLHLYRCAGYRVEGVRGFNNGRDGGYIWGAGDQPITGSTIMAVQDNGVARGCIFDGNARQGVSVVGGRNILFDTCAFQNTGQTTNVGTGANVSSAPAAGVDLEPNSGYGLAGVTFRSCTWTNNVGQALLQGNALVNRVLVDGGEAWGGFAAAAGVTAGSGDFVYINAAPANHQFDVKNARIHASMAAVGAGCTFTDCKIDDDAHPILGRSAANRAYLLTNGKGTFHRCQFRLTGPTSKFYNDSSGANPLTFIDCDFDYGGSLADGSQLAYHFYANAHFLGRNRMTLSVAPATGYYIYTHNSIEILGPLVLDPLLYWGAVGGSTGMIVQTSRVAAKVMPTGVATTLASTATLAQVIAALNAFSAQSVADENSTIAALQAAQIMKS